MSWNWRECPFLIKNVRRDEKSGYGEGAVYDKCSDNLVGSGECSYPFIYIETGKDGYECGTHKLIRLAKKTKKRARTLSAYD